MDNRHTLTERQIMRLRMVEAAENEVHAKNKRRADRGKFRRLPVGEMRTPDRLLHSLERRGLLSAERVEGTTKELYSLTPYGQEVLDAARNR